MAMAAQSSSAVPRLNASDMQLIHTTDFEDPESVQLFVERLERERDEYEAAGKYLEASRCHEKLKSLQADAARRSREALRTRQAAELVAVEEAFFVEKRQFESLWQQKELEYDETTQRLEEAMIERHGLERAAHLDELHERFPFRPKWSKAVISMRNSEKNLVKQKLYEDAMKQKQQADRKEREEMHAQQVEYDLKCQNMQAKLVSKQKAELEALRYRIKAGRKEQKRIRAQDLERITQRYNNIRADVESGHKIERVRVDRMVPNLKGGVKTARGSRPSTARSARSSARRPAQAKSSRSGARKSIDNYLH